MQPLDVSDPRVVAGYRLVGRLGAGGMGQVYLAISPGGQPVAFKMILPHLARQTEFRARFRREVAVARAVRGPYVAEVVDADADATPPWLATQYVPGPSLAEAVSRWGPLPSASVAAFGAGVAEALLAVHQAGLVHRDLKPSNVLLAVDGPRVIDFGIAKALEASALTQTGLVVGTPGFMAPEQINGDTLDAAADVFSLGAVLAYALAGTPPFGEGTPQALMGRVLYAEPDLARVPTDWRDLVRRCLAKQPSQRPTLAALVMMLSRGARVADLFRPGWLPQELFHHVRERDEDFAATLGAYRAGPTRPAPDDTDEVVEEVVGELVTDEVARSRAVQGGAASRRVVFEGVTSTTVAWGGTVSTTTSWVAMTVTGVTGGAGYRVASTGAAGDGPATRRLTPAATVKAPAPRPTLPVTRREPRRRGRRRLWLWLTAVTAAVVATLTAVVLVTG